MECYYNTVEFLLVEDNPADVRLTQEAIKESKLEIHLNVVNDGVQAMNFLEQKDGFSNAPRPKVILLDLNMPKMDGREVLEKIKSSENLKRIPVIVLTSSTNYEDVIFSYRHQANCYISKPLNFEDFLSLVREVSNFWLKIASIPLNGDLSN